MIITKIPQGGAEDEEIPEWARGDGYGRALNNINIIIPNGGEEEILEWARGNGYGRAFNK